MDMTESAPRGQSPRLGAIEFRYRLGDAADLAERHPGKQRKRADLIREVLGVGKAASTQAKVGIGRCEVNRYGIVNCRGDAGSLEVLAQFVAPRGTNDEEVIDVVGLVEGRSRRHETGVVEAVDHGGAELAPLVVPAVESLELAAQDRGLQIVETRS